MRNFAAIVFSHMCLRLLKLSDTFVEFATEQLIFLRIFILYDSEAKVERSADGYVCRCDAFSNSRLFITEKSHYIKKLKIMTSYSVLKVNTRKALDGTELRIDSPQLISKTKLA